MMSLWHQNRAGRHKRCSLTELSGGVKRESPFYTHAHTHALNGTPLVPLNSPPIHFPSPKYGRKYVVQSEVHGFNLEAAGFISCQSVCSLTSSFYSASSWCGQLTATTGVIHWAGWQLVYLDIDGVHLFTFFFFFYKLHHLHVHILTFSFLLPCYRDWSLAGYIRIQNKFIHTSVQYFAEWCCVLGFFILLYSVYMHLSNLYYANNTSRCPFFINRILLLELQRLLYYGAKQQCFFVEKKSLLGCFFSVIKRVWRCCY